MVTNTVTYIQCVSWIIFLFYFILFIRKVGFLWKEYGCTSGKIEFLLCKKSLPQEEGTRTYHRLRNLQWKCTEENIEIWVVPMRAQKYLKKKGARLLLLTRLSYSSFFPSFFVGGDSFWMYTIFDLVPMWTTNSTFCPKQENQLQFENLTMFLMGVDWEYHIRFLMIRLRFDFQKSKYVPKQGFLHRLFR